jgi:ADP-ribose pyrophosphatase YjhB (NUDIX family)
MKDSLKAREFNYCPLCKGRLRRKQIDGYKRLVCRTCDWIYYYNPLPVVVCAARDKKGRILLGKRNLNPGMNKWALPGGFVEAHECPEDACLRELKEETGLRGVIKKLTGIYTQKTMQYGSLLIIGYEVSVIRARILLNSELQDARFFIPRDMPFIPFSSHREIIKDTVASANG